MILMTTLYRAADSGSILGPTCFAAKKLVARAYLDNPGFGGASLYRAVIEIDVATVLDIRSESDAEQLRSLIDARGVDMGATTADWLVMQDATADALIERGYQWVVLLDTFPALAETWVYLGAGDEPELEQIGSH